MDFKNILKPTKKKLFLLVALLVITGIFLLGSGKKNIPVQSSPVVADTSLVKKHLTALTQTSQFRNHKNIDQLNAVADDNATGVTALLELSRMLKGQKLNYRIDLVAYTLEEPPYFRTENMGSYIHAKYLKDNNIDVYGMASVEMIGYFKDEKGSQDFPIGVLSWIYGDKGDFITLVRKFTGAGPFVRNFIDNFKDSDQIKAETFPAPGFVKGVDFSDHLNYWKFDFPALMITDTSFFRNKNYHETTDTLETLDLKKMTKVIDGIFLSIIHLK